MKPYNSDLIPYARAMRKEMTSAERRLWFCCLRLAPHKFRRQRPVGNYITDFYSAELGLVVEVDGDSHFEDEHIAYDRKRTAFLESRGLRVLRFTNEEISREFDAVKTRLLTEFKLRATLASPAQ